MKVTINDIGKKFYPCDNSYSIDLNTGESVNINKNGGLAGHWKADPVLVKVISSPFKMKVTFLDITTNHEFVIVEYKGKAYMVLNEFTEKPIALTPLMIILID